MSTEHKDGFHFFHRRADRRHPAGITVSKAEALPEGDFRITEYKWGQTALWFVDADGFDADERQAAFESFVMPVVVQPQEPRP